MTPAAHSRATAALDGSISEHLDAIILDIGGTLVAEAPPGTATTELEVRCLPHVLEDLRMLARSVRLAAATNTAVMFEADVRCLLAPSGLDDLLEVVVTSADVGVAKPDPTVLIVTLERLGAIPPDRALFIGDQPSDAEAAAAAGMPFASVHPDGVRAALQAWLDKRDGAGQRRWSRPVPLIGDPTSAAERSAQPDAWRLSDEDRRGLYEAIHTRRDVRRFRPDPINGDLVHRVLHAAHAAPSVGHSQPWRFVLVTDAATRERAAWIADQERLTQAAQLTPAAGQHLLDLQLEGIREAPMGIVVCCDRRAPAAGVLGRRTFTDTDLWSCACAIENLWLAARAEGLGVGWVTLFPPEELAALLGLPVDVVPLGWLCIGWPDERPPAPGLERAGWSTRLALDDVVVHERWPATTDGPAPPVSKLRAPDQDAVVAARDAADTLLTPLGSLGVLDRAIDRVVALGHADLSGGTLVLAGGRHPVANLGVSAFATTVTDEVLDAARSGGALGVVAATSAGLGIAVIDGGASTGNLRDDDALSQTAVRALVDRGIVVGREVAGRGLVALGEVGVGNTTVAAALAAVLLGLDADEVVGLGAGADTAIVERKRQIVAASLQRSRLAWGDQVTEPLNALECLGGPEFALLTGVSLGAAERGAPIILDGLATSVAALLAVLIEPAVASHLIAGQRSRETAHSAVLARLGLEPLLDLRFRSGEGAGACLAANLLLHALRIRSRTARTR
jgi:nicotinate-nucleotide--dimethylbenzimidazole phosphoribosyltransferase